MKAGNLLIDFSKPTNIDGDTLIEYRAPCLPEFIVSLSSRPRSTLIITYRVKRY